MGVERTGEECERWAFENPNHPTTAGFRLSGLNSPWLDWKTDLIDEYREAKRVLDMGDDSLMRVFYNTKVARPWRVLGKAVQFDLFNDRREVYECHSHEADIPDGVLLLTAQSMSRIRRSSMRSPAGARGVNAGESKRGNSKGTHAIRPAGCGIKSISSS